MATTQTKKPNILSRIRNGIDALQRKHPALGFPYAVIKKYGEDEAGYQAALLTYYAFLAIFPLLLVLTTVLGLVAAHNQELQNTVLKGLNEYFPALGGQLAAKIGTINKSGIALVVGVIFTLYGARGVADAFRHGVNKIWHIPRVKRDGFPKSLFKSLSIILLGGSGFLLAAISSTYAGSAGTGVVFHVLALAVNVIILFGLFTFLLKISLPGRVTFRDTKAGAVTAALGVVLLQFVGGAIVRSQLRNLDALYSSFAVPLGLLFWLYLQAQVLYYSIEIAAVRSQKLWPRAIDNKKLTSADKRAYTRISASGQYLSVQKITTKFRKD
ncbi:MAG: ribonuclease [Candidatus Saccharibacteria bacterium]|nr:ribonuclease [Candidatus Saccharibacteria bacterium]